MRRRDLFSLIVVGAAGGLLGLAFGGVLPLDPDFCEKKCPICTRARNGGRVARALQSTEMAVTFGGCPASLVLERVVGIERRCPS